jgi:outer membrane protein assembly factor BamA
MKSLVVILLLVIINPVPAQVDTGKYKPLYGSTIEPFPIISYDTDAGFGYGAKLFILNILNKNESFDFTLFNSSKGERWYRLVFSIPDFEFRQGKIYNYALDFTLDYDKWINNNFYGTGYNSENFPESYTKEPLEIGLALSRGFTEQMVGQAGLKYKAIRNYNFKEKSKILQLKEINSGRADYCSFFLNFRYDKRNSFINPTEGLALECESEFAFPSRFTNVSFARYSGCFKYFIPVIYPNIVFAMRMVMNCLSGEDLPIQVLMPIGGNNTLRGFSQDRFLDYISTLYNLEFRFPVYWRFGGVAGLDMGRVSHSLNDFSFAKWAYNPVIGIRFYMDTFIVRFDIGISKETTGIYFNFGHIY